MLQEKLREAAKAQLRRMCKKHPKRKDLDAPEWVVREYKSRPQNELAELLIRCNFDKATFKKKLETWFCSDSLIPFHSP